MTVREVLQRLLDACDRWDEKATTLSEQNAAHAEYVNSYAEARAYLAQPEPQDEALEKLTTRCQNYQASRDYAISLLAKALGVEDDNVRAIEYYARLAAEKIAESQEIIDTLHETCAHYEERLSIAEPIMRAAIAAQAKENEK